MPNALGTTSCYPRGHLRHPPPAHVARCCRVLGNIDLPNLTQPAGSATGVLLLLGLGLGYLFGRSRNTPR